VLFVGHMRACGASGLSFEVEFDDDGASASRPRRVTWPLALCALIAIVAASAAITASPLGQRREVRPYTTAARAAIATAWHDVASRAQRIAREEWR
jgi:hypothetical protein